MSSTKYQLIRHAARTTLAGFLAASTFAFAQDSSALPTSDNVNQQQTTTGGWKKVGDHSTTYVPDQSNNMSQNTDSSPSASPDPNQAQQYPPYQASQDPNAGGQQGYPPQTNQPNGQPPYGQQPNGQQQNYPPPPPVPARLTVPAGTYVTVRINQMLSSDKNQPGEPFTASLVQPVVVNGVVVADPGQTLGGQVVTAQKHHSDTPGRLGIQLTNMTLVDGQQLPIATQFISQTGRNTAAGQEVGTVAATTGAGAVIGAIAGWGTGAAIGAGPAGAAAGLIGVLVTRHHASVIYPEQILTFRITAPVGISTGKRFAGLPLRTTGRI